MESNGQLFGSEMALVAMGLLLFGVFYNWFVERIQKYFPDITAELVAGGVFVTVMASAFVIGFINAAVVLTLFVASGAPMMIGSLYRDWRDAQEARHVMNQIVNGHKKEIK